jgi:hypothetical protein
LNRYAVAIRSVAGDAGDKSAASTDLPIGPFLRKEWRPVVIAEISIRLDGMDPHIVTIATGTEESIN